MSRTRTTASSLRRRRLASASLAALAVPSAVAAAGLFGASPADALAPQPPQSVTFVTGGPSTTFTVPADTYSVTITAVGGSGGSGGGGAGSNGGAGGVGATVTETVAVTPGETLYAYAGGAGQSNGTGGRGYGDLLGIHGGAGDSEGDGGGGGAASEVGTASKVLEVAGGGGGGGGGGAVVGYDGGAGGAAGQGGTGGSGPGAGSGSSGNVAGSGSVQVGSAGQSAGFFTLAGGGGGGGSGWNGATLGGGVGGSAGGGGGGGGGGASGGLSYASDPAATISLAASPGDGSVTISWSPGIVGRSTVAATPNPGFTGQPITFTDTITPDVAGAPAATGTVTFQEFNVHTAASTDLATVPLVNGVATWTTTGLAAGTHQVTAVYDGDANYFPIATGYFGEVVKAAVTTFTLTPDPVAFGNQAVGSSTSKVVTLTDTGNVPWSWTGSSTDNATVNLSGKSTCFAQTVQPGGTCTFIVLYGPVPLGADNGVLTSTSNFPTPAVINVTGTGVKPVKTPVVTGINPKSGPSAGGTRVTVTGQNFTAVTGITVGTNKAKTFSCPTATTCTVVTPSGTGVHNITVTNSAGTSTKVTADQFTYKA